MYHVSDNFIFHPLSGLLIVLPVVFQFWKDLIAIFVSFLLTVAVAQSVRAFALHAEGWVFDSRDRPMSKQEAHGPHRSPEKTV